MAEADAPDSVVVRIGGLFWTLELRNYEHYRLVGRDLDTAADDHAPWGERVESSLAVVVVCSTCAASTDELATALQLAEIAPLVRRVTAFAAGVHAIFAAS